MRSAFCLLCLALAFASAGNTGEKKKQVLSLKIENVNEERIKFSTADGKDFIVKFADTKVEVIDKAGKNVQGFAKYAKENPKEIEGQTVKVQIENGGEEPKVPPKSPPKRIVIRLGKGNG